MYFVYSALLTLGLLLATPYWLYEILRHGKYRKGLSERLGIVPKRIRNSSQPSIWIHAVSVGEVLAVSQLITGLRAGFPKHRIVISTTTDTGQKLATQRFGAENVFYFPLDFAFCMRRYVATLEPALVVIAETEFWPNFLRISRKSGARIAVVNARISDRSLPGYRRWRTILRRVLRNVDLFLAQTSEDQRRLTAIGAADDKVFVAGNLKYDVTVPAPGPIAGQLRSAISTSGAGPVLVCGSTVDGEEPLLITAFQAVLTRYSRAVMLLAPRHPQRFSEVADLLQQLRIKFFRRSEWQSTGEAPTGNALAGRVLLVDSIGELSSLYALADVAFVGGSLVQRGGHNIIEPAQYGVPILVGPYTENFRDIVELFRARDAVRIVTAGDLSSVVMTLLNDKPGRDALGRRAAETLDSQRGATQFTMQKLSTLLAHQLVEANHA
jgi:3-deoxy-D-manno-octulosonic-acid transferase